MSSDSTNSVKLCQYDVTEDRIKYDLVVYESDPYNGECLIDTEEGKQYFGVIETKGDWSISGK